ncbi:MAG: iron-sulfur cluster assembly scaffold protein [Planctomycetales bacterium]
MSDELYSDHILDEVEAPYHRGHAACPTISHQEKIACGDEVHLEIVVDEKRCIREAWFQATGCMISLAAASVLTREIEGKSLDDLRGLQASQMLDLLKVPLTMKRQQCGLVAFKVLKAMIYALDTATRSGTGTAAALGSGGSNP